MSKQKEPAYRCLLRRHGISPIQPRDTAPPSKLAYLEECLDGVAITANEADIFKSRGFITRYRLGELPTEEVGNSGERFSAGLPISHDRNTTFRPVMARGSGYSHGLYHEVFLGSTTYRRAWSNIAEALTTGAWTIEAAVPGDGETWSPREVDEAKRQAAFIHKTLLDKLEGGWTQFIREWLYQLIGGNAPFEAIYYPFGHELAGGIRRLSFRYPSSVNQWLLDPQERDLVAVEFERGDGSFYILPADHILLSSWDRFGTNFEGISPLRSVTRWYEFLTLLVQLQALAAEKYGVPWVYAARDGSGPPVGSDLQNKLQEILDAALAEDAPVIALPDGVTAGILVGPGGMPNFLPAIQHCEQKIAEILRSEGSLIGLGDTGAYAARESAAGDLIRFAPYFGALVASDLNGANNTPYTGIVKRSVDARFGGPIHGKYPQVAFSVGASKDTSRLDKINASIQAGSLTVTPDVENAIRAELELDPLPAGNGKTTESEGDTDE